MMFEGNPQSNKCEGNSPQFSHFSDNVVPVKIDTFDAMRKKNRELQPVLKRLDLNEYVGHAVVYKELLEMNVTMQRSKHNAQCSPAMSPEWHQPQTPPHPF